jgi:signal transduction histidine kinase
MVDTPAARLLSVAGKTARNPHVWVVVLLSALLLLIYQVWPWREWQFVEGVWRYFPWLSNLGFLVLDVELKLRVLGVLFFIPIIYGAVTLSWPGGVFAWLLSLIWVVPALLSSWGNMQKFTNLLLLLLPAILAAIISGERRWRAGEKRYYAEREHERQAYIAKLVDTQEAERRRIAQEIHDETLQTLLIVANKLDSLSSAPVGNGQTEGIVWAKQKLFQSMDDLRRLSMNLRPSILDNFGLVAGVRWVVDNTTQGGYMMSTRVRGQVRKLSSLAEVTVFRVVQEAVFNIQRHAHAQRASVTLDFGDDQLMLEIQDDGVGFEQPERLADYAAKGRLGIIGMEQRILALGGTMCVRSSPGSGTVIQATIPYSASDELVQVENA